MSTFFVNGKSVTTTRKQSLLRFLRDELKLTSVKDGCSQGACGACTIIIDGETCRPCVPTTEALLTGNPKFTPTLTGKQVLYSAVSVSLAWLCVPKHC